MIGGIEHHLAVGQDALGLPKVNHGRGQHADAGVAMLLVVPLEKLLAEGAAVLDAAEAIREFRAVLQRAELGDAVLMDLAELPGGFEEEADGMFGVVAVLEGVHGGAGLAFGGFGAAGLGAVDAGLFGTGE